METNKEIVVNLDSKKLLSAGIVLVLIITVFFSYFMALLAFDAPSVDSPLRISNELQYGGYGKNKLNY
jgi:hypothetical protein